MHVFKVTVIEGRGFGSEVQALICSGSFNGETKTTTYSVSSDLHTWDSTLMWAVEDRNQLRRLQASAGAACKLAVLRKDGTRLGWVVLHLRDAKMRHQYGKHAEGEWLQLTASAQLDGAALRVAYSFGEDTGVLSSSGSTNSLHAAADAVKQQRTPSLRRRGAAGAGAVAGGAAASPKAGDGGGRAEQQRGEQAQEQEPEQRQLDQDAASSLSLRTRGARRRSGPAISGPAVAAEAGPEPSLEVGAAAAAASEDLGAALEPEEAGELGELLQAGMAAVADATEATALAAEVDGGKEHAVPEQGEQQQQQQPQEQRDLQLQAPATSGVTGASPALLKQPAQERAAAAAAPEVPKSAALAVPVPLGLVGEEGACDAVAAPAEVGAGSAAPAVAAEVLPPPAVRSEAVAAAGAPVLAPRQQQAPELQEQRRSDAPAAVPTSGGAGAPLDTPRRFALSLDVRSLQAGRRLPVNLASAYVQAHLPSDLLSFMAAHDARVPPRATPLRTHPAVEIARGSEGALPNGFVSLDFSCGVMALASLLAGDPRLTLEVWHKERFRADTLLGVASVPLSALLDEAWVDGYAPVMALMARAGDHALAGAEERVQVALLRVVLSLEEQGPSGPHRPPTDAAAAVQPFGSPARGPRSGLAAPAAPLQKQRQDAGGGRGTTARGAGGNGGEEHADTDTGAAVALTPAADAPDPLLPPYLRPLSPRGAHAPSEQPMPAGAAPALGAGEKAGMAGDAAGRDAPEYLVAWELEVWKKAEEAKWRAELKEREQQRMAALEAEWRRRERAREAEAAALRAEYSHLDARAKQVLAAAEDREARLVAADEQLARRRTDLEREHAARMEEAEAAVRRLQVECEHQLSIERDRCSEALRQRAATEERLLAAEARAAALEAAFADYRQQQRATPEGELQRQLLEARHDAGKQRAKAAQALEGKRRYKEQVVRLAHELAALHKERQATQLQLSAAADAAAAAAAARARAEAAAGEEAAALRAAAEREAGLAAARREEVAELQSQLRRLRSAALGGANDAASDGGDGCELDEEAGSPRQGPGSADEEGPLSPAASPEARGGWAGGAAGGGPPGAALDDLGQLAALLNSPSRRRPAAAAARDAAGGGRGSLQPECTDPPGAGGAASGGGGGGSGGGDTDTGGCGGQEESPAEAAAEVRRLLRERAELLGTGLYRRDDDVICQLDARAAQLAAAAGDG